MPWVLGVLVSRMLLGSVLLGRLYTVWLNYHRETDLDCVYMYLHLLRTAAAETGQHIQRSGDLREKGDRKGRAPVDELILPMSSLDGLSMCARTCAPCHEKKRCEDRISEETDLLMLLLMLLLLLLMLHHVHARACTGLRMLRVLCGPTRSHRVACMAAMGRIQGSIG
jgi:hypothetical protein